MKEDPITKLIRIQQLASVMNRTKWRELAQAMTSNPDFEPQVRIKYLTDEVPQGFALQYWDWVSTAEARVIEWMDIDATKREYVGRLVDDTRTDFTPWVKSALEKHSIPFSE